MKKFVFSLLIFSGCIYAQKGDLGKVTVEELSQTQHPKDASAEAAFLFDIGKSEVVYDPNKGFVMQTTNKAKIKIYKKEGYRFADVELAYYLEGEKVRFKDAATYNLVDGKIVKTKLKSDGEFDEKTSRFYGKKKITLPAVKEGSIIEYEYVITSEYLQNLTSWNFQCDVPVNYSEFRTSIPEYFVYNTRQKGYIFPKVSTELMPRSIVINGKERSGVYSISATFTQDKIDYTETTTIFVLQDIPAMRDESFVNNINNYRSSVSHELSMTRYPNAMTKNFATDWETVARTIFKGEDFGGEIDKTGYFDQEIGALLSSISDPVQRMNAVFNYVRSGMKWNGYFGFSCNDGVKTAFKNKTGNVGEINLMLTAMLRHAKLDANPVLVSTRANGIAMFPSRSAFNYVITSVKIGDKHVLLDATDSYTVPGILPLRDLNWNGILIRKDGTSEAIPLIPSQSSKEAVTLMYKLAADGSVSGQARKSLSDNMALNFRNKFFGGNEEQYLETYENANGMIEISDYLRENEKDLDKPIVEKFSFRKSNAVEVVGDRMYVSPMLFLQTKENPFKMETREYPVDFGYPMSMRYNIVIEIPDGYAVESLPESKSLTMEEKLGSHKYIIGQSGKNIQLSVATEINEAIVPNFWYPMLRDFFSGLVQKEGEKIVLKKV